MTVLTFSEEEQHALHKERFEHPHPRVQQRMEVLWLISQGVVYAEAARLAGVAEATVDRYVAIYRQGGLEGTPESCEARSHPPSLEGNSRPVKAI